MTMTSKKKKGDRDFNFYILHDNGLKTIQGEGTILLQKIKSFPWLCICHSHRSQGHNLDPRVSTGSQRIN